jgi:hypothetical protein
MLLGNAALYNIYIYIHVYIYIYETLQNLKNSEF